MKKYLFTVLLFAVFCSFAQESAKREEKLALSLAQYPAVIAEFGKHKLLKKEVIKLVVKKYPDFENYSFDEIDRVCESMQQYALNISELPFTSLAKPNHSIILSAINVALFCISSIS